MRDTDIELVQNATIDNRGGSVHATPGNAIRQPAGVTFRGRASCHSTRMMATLSLVVLAACARRPATVRSANSSSPLRPEPKASSPSGNGFPTPAGRNVAPIDRAGIAQVGITSPCVLHAGDSDAKRIQKVMSTGGLEMVVTAGSCSFNAECLQQQGKDVAGDGNVELDCRDRSCSCSYRRWSPAEKLFSFAFSIEEICSTADMAERLLRDACLVGLKVDSGSGGTDGRRHQ